MWLRRASVFTVLCVLCACGGGGNGTSEAPIPEPPATATGIAPSSGAGSPSRYSVVSVPSGLHVSVKNGATANALTTPVSVTPNASNFATTISITPSNGAPAYSVSVDQNNGGAASILYDQNADTNGSIASVSALSTERKAAAVRAANAGPFLRIAPQSSAGRPAYSDRYLIVRYRAGASFGTVERELGVPRAYGLGRETETRMVRVLEAPEGISVDEFARRLRTRSEVTRVEGDAFYYKQASSAVAPDDTHYNDYDQWDMFDIGAPNAWGYTEGSPAVAIAMIDTGVDATSPDFAGAKLGYSESVLDGTVTPGLSAVQDTDGHGTNTGGIAAADTNNAFGFAGTGYDVGLQIYKVFPNDTAANNYQSTALASDVTQAIDDSVSHGAKVINLSLGTCQVSGVDSAQQEAIEKALASGVVVVAAAGNERAGSSSSASHCRGGTSTIDFPAAFPGVISVGATSLNDAADPMNPATATEYVASYSNSGPGLSLVAPGGDPTAAEIASTGTPDILHWIFNLYSTTAADPSERCADKSDCKALFAGTSQATPHVSGIAALMLKANGSLTPARVKSILIATADDIQDPNQGNGRLDGYRALAAVTGDPNPPVKPADINFVAIAYVPNGTNRPDIIDVTYPRGAPVARNGTFRIADVPAGAASYKIGVWYDANGDGVVDAGDYFGSSQTCSANAACTSAASIVATAVASGFVLQ
jgi:thermitase